MTVNNSVNWKIIQSPQDTYDFFLDRRWIVDKDNGPWQDYFYYSKHHDFNPLYVTYLNFGFHIRAYPRQEGGK